MVYRYGLTIVLAMGAILLSVPAAAQVNPTPTVGGVYIDADGVLRYREVDTRRQLPPRRSAQAQAEGLCHISLPRLFAEAKELAAAGKPLPDRMRYLGGLTQIQYIFVDAQEKDLIIAGPAEPWDAANPLQPIGLLTGRPVMHLDDLVVALRVGGRGGPLGCTIDPPADALQRAQEAMNRVGSRSRAQLAEAVAQSIGPQAVKVFGAAAETRYAMICVAADYKLKRLSLGLDSSPVSGVGHGIDNSRAAGNRYWFELMYEPILVSPEGDAYELRGQRLGLKCGAMSFDAKGATPAAERFTEQFTKKLPALAAALPILADLQNLADLTVVAALIRQDKLDEKTGWDRSWIVNGYQTQAYPTPSTTETVVSFRGGSLAAGGVILSPQRLVQADAREVERQGVLKGKRHAIPAGQWYVGSAGEESGLRR